MEIRILKEAGVEEAIGGMGFSYQLECPLDQVVTIGGMKGAIALARKDGGHNKFLESIVVWMDIRAPMSFWKQFDTYRVGVTKLSKSTMHTIMKREIRASDFCCDVPIETLDLLNELRVRGEFEVVISLLPMGYLQTRRVCLNYKSLRNIILQRRWHKLPEWAEFIKEMGKLDSYRLLGV